MPLPVLDFWFDFASTYSYVAAMRIGPLAEKADVRVRFRPFLLGPIFKAQAGPPRRSTSIRPKAAICGATSSGRARSCNYRSGVPIPFRRTVCSRPARRSRGSTRHGAKNSAARSFARNSPTGVGSTTPQPSATSWRDLTSTPGPRWQPPDRMRSKRGCGRKPRRRSASASSARRASRPPTANCSGAMTGSSRPFVGPRPRTSRDWEVSKPPNGSWIEPHGQAGTGHVPLRVGDAVLAEVKDRGREHRGGVAVADALDQVLQRADPARGDHRHRHRIGDGAGQRNVETLLGAVAVHGGEQDFAGAERDHLARVIDRIEPGGIAAAMGKDFPALPLVRLRHAFGVDRNHDALVAELFRRLLDEGAPGDRRGVDRHLVGARSQELADVLDRAHSAANGERHEASLGGAPHHVENDVAVLMAGGDVEEREFVGAGRVIRHRRHNRIAGVAQVEEFYALDDTAVLDVETGNDADLEHVVTSPLAPCGSTATLRSDRAGRRRARGR